MNKKPKKSTASVVDLPLKPIPPACYPLLTSLRSLIVLLWPVLVCP